MKIPKELIKEYVKSEKFTNTTDIMESIKSMFAAVFLVPLSVYCATP